MQVNVQKLSPVLVEFAVEVEADRVKAEVDKAYKSVAKNARVRGFRKGKTPRKVLSHMFGARVAADVAQRLVDETFPKAVSEQQMQPVSSPAIEPDRLVETQAFSYKARFEIIPQIESVTYEGLEAKRGSTEVSDEELAEELELLRKENSTLVAPKEARPSKPGDVATLDFEVKAGDVVVEGAGAKGFQVELGAGTLLSGIEDAVLGKKEGETTTAQVDMPDTHPHPGLRGRTVTFEIEVKDVKERVLPELDDEFAKDLGEFETLEALKADVKKQIEERKKEASENALAEHLVLELVKANPVPVPPSLVRQQAQLTEREILDRARSQGQTATGLGDELRQKVQADSEVKVRAGLLMAEIAKKEGIKIGEAEIEEGIKELAAQTGKNVAKVRAEYSGSKQREFLIGMILENKVLDIIQAKAKVSDP